MSSSGLIYAVIVGAWAAYLVPMWLRRQDELNEARPTERFSTAIRLLSGRAGMERRYAKDLKARAADQDEPAHPDATGSVDVRAFAAPSGGEQQPAEPGPPRRPEVTAPRRPEDGPTPRRSRQGAPAPEGQAGPRPPAARRAVPAEGGAAPVVSAPVGGPGKRRPEAQDRQGAARRAAEAAARARRSKVLARRRRTTVVLFLAFTLGAVGAAVGGLAFLWAPAVPAVLLSAYIAHLRGQERRRFTYTMDRRRAEAAAQRLRERGSRPRHRPAQAAPDAADAGPADAADHSDGAAGSAPAPALSALAAGRRALVEQTDHAEWVDQQRERRRAPADGAGWDPVPVPLPTYVTAPVAPRATGDLDLGAPDAWSSARSSTAGGEQQAPEAPQDGEAGEGGGARRAAAARRARERGSTPLFDQYADGDRPRAANE